MVAACCDFIHRLHGLKHRFSQKGKRGNWLLTPSKIQNSTFFLSLSSLRLVAFSPLRILASVFFATELNAEFHRRENAAAGSMQLDFIHHSSFII
jgi:hypothetical protein